MKIYVIDPNIKLAAVYYNKDQLNQINRQLNHKDTRRVDGVEYRCSSTDSVRTLRFSRMKLKNDDDMRSMFSIFGQYITKRLVELYTSLVWSVEQIQKSLIRPRNYEEIRALLEGQMKALVYMICDLLFCWIMLFFFSS